MKFLQTLSPATSAFRTQAYATIRRVLGKDVAVYVGDMFNPKNFNWPVAASAEN